jgi:hypothetical protein
MRPFLCFLRVSGVQSAREGNVFCGDTSVMFFPAACAVGTLSWRVPRVTLLWCFILLHVVWACSPGVFHGCTIRAPNFGVPFGFAVYRHLCESVYPGGPKIAHITC